MVIFFRFFYICIQKILLFLLCQFEKNENLFIEILRYSTACQSAFLQFLNANILYRFHLNYTQYRIKYCKLCHLKVKSLRFFTNLSFSWNSSSVLQYFKNGNFHLFFLLWKISRFKWNVIYKCCHACKTKLLQNILQNSDISS